MKTTDIYDLPIVINVHFVGALCKRAYCCKILNHPESMLLTLQI